MVCGSLLLIVVAVECRNSVVASPLRLRQSLDALFGIPAETDDEAPTDYGAGPGVKPDAARTAVATLAGTTGGTGIPVAGPEAYVTGTFGAAVAWPIIPIHAVLVPDGRVMNYGSNESGQQGAELLYDVWTPSLGTGMDAHLVLPNKTGTDIFCSSQSVTLAGNVLTTGGDAATSRSTACAIRRITTRICIPQ
jgi:hypothetical protein